MIPKNFFQFWSHFFSCFLVWRSIEGWRLEQGRASTSAAGGETLAQPLHPHHPRPTVNLEERCRPAHLGVETVLEVRGGGEGVVAGPGHVGGGAALVVPHHPTVGQAGVPGHPAWAQQALAGQVGLGAGQLLVVQHEDRQGDGGQDKVGHHTHNYDREEAHCYNQGYSSQFGFLQLR